VRRHENDASNFHSLQSLWLLGNVFPLGEINRFVPMKRTFAKTQGTGHRSNGWNRQGCTRLCRCWSRCTHLQAMISHASISSLIRTAGAMIPRPTRYDKLAASYLAFVQFASIGLWLRADESA